MPIHRTGSATTPQGSRALGHSGTRALWGILPVALFALVANTVLTTTAHADFWHVIESYPGSPSGTLGSATNPYTGQNGIQDAIDDASHGDTILVAGGTYTNFAFPAYGHSAVDLKVLAENSWTQYGSGSAVIDGSTSSIPLGVFIGGGQTSATVLAGFVLQNWSGLVGCAIRIHPVGGDVNGLGSSPTITDCDIIDNCTNGLSNYGGAGMQIGWSCHPLVEGCYFENNITGCNDSNAGYGGAVWIYGAGIGQTECHQPEVGSPDLPDPIFIDCVFVGNTSLNHASGAGGAVAITCGKGQFYDCEFVGNSATDRGGAIYGKLTDGTIVEGCTFEADNSADKGGAIYLEGHPEEDYFERFHVIASGFDGNTANRGGAIYVLNKDLTVAHSTFLENVADESTAALWYGRNRQHDNSDPFTALVINNLFGPGHDVPNASSTPHECVIRVVQPSTLQDLIVHFTNNTVAGNTNLRGVTLNNDNDTTPLTFSCYNSIIYYNTTSLTDISIHDAGTDPSDLDVDYSNTEQGGFGGNSISDDPEFVSSTDLRLDSGSPCIDAGDDNLWDIILADALIPDTDLDGNTRIQGSRIDMGCYED